MYKVTVEGKTMVGCNEDAWRTTPRIWFENANSKKEYGVAFTGSRKVSSRQFAPQSGMNQVGLTFSRLASYFPKRHAPENGKKDITNEVQYLTEIMHKCATVEEVKQFIDQYNHSYFLEDVFIYVDSSGRYLVVEPYLLIEEHRPYYVLSNFCPSITTNVKARNLERYRNGEDFLNTHQVEASLSFCSALSDTMHVCRKRNGDGTLLSSIWDTKNKTVSLFFYHDYDTFVQFDLSEELAKGDHILDVSTLFPFNSEFERLTSYKTPFNTPGLRIFLVLIAGVLSILSLLFLIVYLRKRKTEILYKIFIYVSGQNFILIAYLFVLATNINIYYFDAPYTHYHSDLVTISSYIPFLLLLSFIPVNIYGAQLIKNKKKRPWLKGSLVLNNLIYLFFIIMFGYWDLFDI